MGREIKRVPLDFDWPIDKVWGGVRRPDELELPTCPDCNGLCRDSSYRWLDHLAHLLLMLGEDPQEQQRGQRLHPWLAEASNGYDHGRPTASATELSTGLAGRAPRLFGHDAIDQWSCTKKIILAAGLDPDTWAVCQTCGGKGDVGTDEQRAAYDAWVPTDPPGGEGWQLWETTSEGSPISPVFATGDELASWMSKNRCGVGGTIPTLKVALEWVHGPGWSPSGLMIGGQSVNTFQVLGKPEGPAIGGVA